MQVNYLKVTQHVREAGRWGAQLQMSGASDAQLRQPRLLFPNYVTLTKSPCLPALLFAHL